MDIRNTLASGHSRRITQSVVDYVGGDRVRFSELMTVFLESEYRITQRAAWPLSIVCISHPLLLKGVTGKLINKLGGEPQHPAITRNILRIFQETGVPAKYQGRMFDFCLAQMVSERAPVAIRAFAITVASHISVNYPELKKELVLILDHMVTEPQSPAITVRIKSAFKELRGVNSKV